MVKNHEKVQNLVKYSNGLQTGVSNLAQGAHGPHGAHGGPMGPNLANVPPIGKTFFRKSTQKIQNVNFGVKTKVVRTKILHIWVGLAACRDPYLTVSWTFRCLTKCGCWDLKPRC